MKKLTSLLLTMILLFSVAAETLPSVQRSSGESIDYVLSQLDLNNTELKRLREEYAQSLLDVKDAMAGYGPTIDLLVTGTYMPDPMVGKITVDVEDILSSLSGSPYSALNGTNTQNGYVTVYKGMENTLYQFQLTVTQPLFTWGKITSSVKLYKAASEVKELQVKNKQEQLEAEIRTRLSAIYCMKKIMALLSEEKEYVTKLVSISEKAEKNGLLLPQKVMEVKIQAQELDIAEAGMNDEYSKMLSALERLTGLDSDTIEDIRFVPDSTGAASMLSESVEYLQDEATDDYSSSLKILRKLIEINSLTVDIADASVYWKPDVALQFSADYSGSRFPLVETDWYRQDSSSLNFTLALKTTVWDGGKKLNNIKRSESNESLAEIQLDESIMTIRNTVLEQYNQMNLSKLKMDYQDLKLQTNQSQTEQAKKAFSTGYGSETDLLKAYIDECNTKIEYIQNQLNYFSAYYTLSYLTGL